MLTEAFRPGRALLAGAILIAAGAVQGAWEGGVARGDADATVYYDPFSLRKSGDIVSIRVLSDLHTPDTYLGIAYASVRTLKEYDCRTQKVRTVEISLYSGPMGSGELVASGLTGPEGWQPLAAKKGASALPQRVIGSLRALVCG